MYPQDISTYHNLSLAASEEQGSVKANIKYQSHTYSINEITCQFIQFLSSRSSRIYIIYDDILIEIYLKLVATIYSSKISSINSRQINIYSSSILTR
jgi:hypothetical protein